jgi:hypothetical protein
MSNEMMGLLGLAVTLLGVVVTSTWKFSALASKLLTAVNHQREDAAEMKARLKALELIPQLELRMGQLERNHSLIPKIDARLVAVEQAVKFSKELRTMRRGSRPDVGEDENEG